jgi:hypothetical protein
MPTPKTPTRKVICTRCCEYAGAGADGLGTCYLHNLMRFPFDSCEFFRHSEDTLADGTVIRSHRGPDGWDRTDVISRPADGDPTS